MLDRWRLRIGVYGGWAAGVVLICVELAAPAHAGDFASVLLIESLWVAFLVVADAYILVRRRRMIRPDYVAFVVALTATTYGISDPVAWASITGAALAVLAAAFAFSLRSQRDRWASKRTAVRSTAPASPGDADRTVL